MCQQIDCVLVILFDLEMKNIFVSHSVRRKEKEVLCKWIRSDTIQTANKIYYMVLLQLTKEQ